MALAKLDPEAKLARLQLANYFYHRANLFIVTNVLGDSLCVFYKYLAATHPSSGVHDSPGGIALSDATTACEAACGAWHVMLSSTRPLLLRLGLVTVTAPLTRLVPPVTHARSYCVSSRRAL